MTPAASGTHVVERYEMRREPWVVRVYYRLVGRSDRLQMAMDETLHRLKAAAEERAAH